MPSYFGRLSCLLLSVQSAWAILRLTVPSSPIQARPGSDAQLPCHIAGTINIADLAVIWKVGERVIAKYEYSFEAKRPGALMTVGQLQAGDATLLLPNVQDADAGVYTCFVILMPDNAHKTVELKVEAPPSLTLGPTKLQLAKPGAVTCKVSDFYPGNISVTWFRDGKMVKGPQSLHAALSPGSLFSAESVLELTPQISDDGANVSCRVNHKAIKGLLEEDFELQVQARPILQVLPAPPEKTFGAAKCLVSGFYPKDVHIQWLRNGVPQLKIESYPQHMPNGTFSIKSAIFTEESDAEVSYVCRVQHEALDAPLEQTILWQPKGLSESLLTWDRSWLGVIGLFLGLLLGAGAVIVYNRVNSKPSPGTKSEERIPKKAVRVEQIPAMESEGIPLKKADEEKAQNMSKPKTKGTDGRARHYQDRCEDVDEEGGQDKSKDKPNKPDDSPSPGTKREPVSIEKEDKDWARSKAETEHPNDTSVSKL